MHAPAVWPEPDPQVAAAIAGMYGARKTERPLAVLIRERLGQRLEDEEFTATFKTRGKPGWSSVAAGTVDRAVAGREFSPADWRPRRCGPGSTGSICWCLLLPDAPGLPGRAGAGGLGITTGGKPAFIGLAPGAGESADAWHDFLQDLKDRACPPRCWSSPTGHPG